MTLRMIHIKGKLRTLSELAKMIDMSPRCVSSRIAVLEKEGRSIDLAIDNKYWKERARGKLAKKWPTPKGEMTLREIAKEYGMRLELLKSRALSIHRNELDPIRLTDNQFWEDRKRTYGRTGRHKMERTMCEEERMALAQIPEPSYLEKQLEEQGIL